MKPRFVTNTSATIISVFLFCLSASAIRVIPFFPNAFFGDDLSNLLAFKQGQFASTLHQAVAASFAQKYRPVFALAIGLLFQTFGDKIYLYLISNLFLHAVNSTLSFCIIKQFVINKYLLPLFMTVAISMSRFALYQVTQVTGLVEGLALSFFLSTVFLWIRAIRSEIRQNLYIALALTTSALAIFTHERYLGLVIWLGVVTCAAPSSARIGASARVTAPLAGALIVGFNLYFKTHVLGNAFLVGTGGSHMDFDIERELDFLGAGLLSIVGINSGPDYLIGGSFRGLAGWTKWAFLGMFLGPMIIAVGFAARSAHWNSPRWSTLWRRLYEPVAIALLFILVLIPVVSTIRLEQRWLVEPFIILVFTFMILLSSAINNYDSFVLNAIGFIMMIGSIGLDGLFANKFDNIFFVSAGRFAAHVKSDIINSDASTSRSLTFFTTSGNCNWTLLGGKFFLIFEGASKSVKCVSSISDLADDPADIDRAFGASDPTGRLVDLTWQTRSRLADFRDSHPYDFLAAFGSGRAELIEPAARPAEHRVFLQNWNSETGTRRALTIASGYAYRYDNVPIEAGETLAFSASEVSGVEYGVKVMIKVDDGAPSDLLEAVFDVTPPWAGEPVAFKPLDFPLQRFEGKTVSIAFAAQSPASGRQRHWVAIADPRIIKRGTPAP